MSNHRIMAGDARRYGMENFTEEVRKAMATVGMGGDAQVLAKALYTQDTLHAKSIGRAQKTIDNPHIGGGHAELLVTTLKALK